MTIDEMAEIMDVLEIAYPAFYARQDESAKLKAMELWATMFADEPAQMVAMAVKAFIASDTKGFPPGIGQIKTIIGKMTMPKELEMTELEAWTKVRRAIRGASMADWSRKLGPDGIGPPSAVVAFEALPEMLQRLVGDPMQLAQWEELPDDEINTVIQSNFMRSWRASVAHEKEMLALPADIRNNMQTLAEGMSVPLLEEKKAR